MKDISNLHKFDVVTILNTKFHKLTVNQLIMYIVEVAKINKKTIIGNVNVRAMNFAYELPWFRDFINKSDIVFCDGFGVLLAAKLYGYSVRREYRMTAPDYIEDLAKACQDNHLSLFLLAGKPGVVDKAITKLLAIAPNLRIEGHHGYFEKSGIENDAVIQKINEFKPDLLYVGFGMPLQERWILDNMSQINTKVFLPLGACLDFYTGSVYRGPRWMTDRGLEWISRLFTEPQRLWQRYLVGNFLFFYRIMLYYWSDRVRRR
ncbi:WecB/TagA/CpsF family glycosyltransferase [Nostoc sp. UHCC 0702]|nr:WecB/TagA/CpsF family glycosyltransferase [Nostoc sp. UHCC 0702]